MLASAGRVDEAIAVFREAVELQPDQAEAWYFLGMGLYTARRDAQALPAFQRAHALAPMHPQIMRALAESHYALEHHAEALRLYERIADAERSDDVMLFLRLSQCRRRSGAPESALEAIRAVYGRDAPPAEEFYLAPHAAT